MLASRLTRPSVCGLQREPNIPTLPCSPCMAVATRYTPLASFSGRLPHCSSTQQNISSKCQRRRCTAVSATEAAGGVGDGGCGVQPALRPLDSSREIAWCRAEEAKQARPVVIDPYAEALAATAPQVGRPYNMPYQDQHEIKTCMPCVERVCEGARWGGGHACTANYACMHACHAHGYVCMYAARPFDSRAESMLLLLLCVALLMLPVTLTVRRKRCHPLARQRTRST